METSTSIQMEQLFQEHTAELRSTLSNLQKERDKLKSPEDEPTPSKRQQLIAQRERINALIASHHHALVKIDNFNRRLITLLPMKEQLENALVTLSSDLETVESELAARQHEPRHELSPLITKREELNRAVKSISTGWHNPGLGRVDVPTPLASLLNVPDLNKLRPLPVLSAMIDDLTAQIEQEFETIST